MELKGSKTEANLMAAFAGESMARNKYTYYASQAKKDGYVQIAEIFQATADNEREHAKLWYKYLNGGKVDDTATNLKAAADGEHEETNNMYPEFARIAKEEGFVEIAAMFQMVGKIEAAHEARYLELLKNVVEGKVFLKEGDQIWVCANCGHIHIGPAAPQLCPVCKHPQAYFALENKNF